MLFIYICPGLIGKIIGKNALIFLLLLLVAVPRIIGEVRRKDTAVFHLNRFHTDIAERKSIARVGIGLTQLQTDRQRSAAGFRCEEHLDVVSLTGFEAAAVKCAVSVLAVAVEAGFVFGLVFVSCQVILDQIARPGFQVRVCGRIEFSLPHPAVIRIGRCLPDDHFGARIAFFHIYNISVVVLFIDRVRAGIERVGQRDLFERIGNQFFQDLPGKDGLIKCKSIGKDALIVIVNLFHADVADNHHASLRRFAKRELQDQLIAVSASADHSFTCRHFSAGQLLTVKSAVALLLVPVVEEDLERHIFLAHHIGEDAVAGAEFRIQAGFDIKSGFPHAGIERRGDVVDIHGIAAAAKEHRIALIVLLINDRLPLKIDRGGKRVLVLHFVRVLFHLNLMKINRKSRQHAELQIEVARAAVRDHDPGDAVIPFMDLELLEVTELDRSGNIGVKTVSHKVIPSRNRRVVAFQLDMPGFPVGLRRVETIDAVYGFAASFDIVSFEFGTEHRGFHSGRRHLVPVLRQRPHISVRRQ